MRLTDTNLRMTIDEKIKRLQKIDLNQIMDEIVAENKEQIIKLNKDQMYDEGIMNVKTEKKEHYSPATIKSKKRAAFNKTQFVTLKWTGDFHESLKLLIFKTFYLITSRDLKWSRWLEPNERFANALGLTDESMDKLRKIVKTGFIKKLRNEL